MEPKPWVWPMRWQPDGGALARRGEGTFDSPSQSVPHAESPGLMSKVQRTTRGRGTET